MRLAIVDRLVHLLERHPAVIMKDHAFEQGFDDLGQAEGDVERQTTPEALASRRPAPEAPPVSRA